MRSNSKTFEYNPKIEGHEQTQTELSSGEKTQGAFENAQHKIYQNLMMVN